MADLDEEVAFLVPAVALGEATLAHPAEKIRVCELSLSVCCLCVCAYVCVCGVVCVCVCMCVRAYERGVCVCVCLCFVVCVIIVRRTKSCDSGSIYERSIKDTHA